MVGWRLILACVVALTLGVSLAPVPGTAGLAATPGTKLTPAKRHGDWAAPQVDCRCRFFGRYFEVGEQTCMKTPDGLRMAQCTKVLNNTAWQLSDTPCPMASVASDR